MPRCRLSAFSLILPLLFAGIAVGQSTIPCAALHNAPPQKLLSYLQGDRSTLHSDCIEIALHDLGQQRYVPAIPILIQYLDFKKTEPNRDGARPLGDAYPAATALDRIGELTIPDVKAAVENESLNRLQRRNAAGLYAGSLSQDLPSNIEFLMQASKEVKDQQVALDLVDMAKFIADRCPPNIQKQCYDALNGN